MTNISPVLLPKIGNSSAVHHLDLSLRLSHWVKATAASIWRNHSAAWAPIEIAISKGNRLTFEGFHSHGGTPKWMVFLGKIPWRWMIFRGSPISGNIHLTGMDWKTTHAPLFIAHDWNCIVNKGLRKIKYLWCGLVLTVTAKDMRKSR